MTLAKLYWYKKYCSKAFDGVGTFALNLPWNISQYFRAGQHFLFRGEQGMGQGSNKNFPGQLFFPEPGLDGACIPEWSHHLEKLVKFSIWRTHYFQGVFLLPTTTCSPSVLVAWITSGVSPSLERVVVVVVVVEVLNTLRQQTTTTTLYSVFTRRLPLAHETSFSMCNKNTPSTYTSKNRILV